MEFKNSTVTQGSYERDYDQGCEAEGRERERERSHDEETRREREETRRSVEGIRLGRDCSAVVQMDKVQECILSLKEILGSNLEEHSLGEELHNHHHRAAKILGEDEHVARAVVGKLSEEMSGHCDDAICRWLYDTFQTRDPYLQTVVLRYIPALCSVYLPRIAGHVNESLAGFEAVLLALYASETKARNGCPIITNIPDLTQPSLYHSPRIPPPSNIEPYVGQLSCPLGPQDEVKATKRACIVGVALDLFSRRIASMPPMAKLEACKCALRCSMLGSSNEHSAKDVHRDSLPFVINDDRESAPESNGYHISSDLTSRQSAEIEIMDPKELYQGNNNKLLSPQGMKYCELDQTSVTDTSVGANGVLPSLLSKYSTLDSPDVELHGSNGTRIHLPWELLQPLLKILSHCLLAPLNPQEVKDAASIAIKALHKRAVHDLVPEAILATRSLMRLDITAKSVAKTLTLSNTGSSTSTPSKPRKPEIFLVSK